MAVLHSKGMIYRQFERFVADDSIFLVPGLPTP